MRRAFLSWPCIVSIRTCTSFTSPFRKYLGVRECAIHFGVWMGGVDLGGVGAIGFLFSYDSLFLYHLSSGSSYGIETERISGGADISRAYIQQNLFLRRRLNLGFLLTCMSRYAPFDLVTEKSFLKFHCNNQVPNNMLPYVTAA